LHKWKFGKNDISEFRLTPKAYQLLAHGWWFSPGIPASSNTKTGRYDIAEILLKYHGGQFYWWAKPEYPDKTTDLTQVTLSINVVYLT
jgi:hypothetical protein